MTMDIQNRMKKEDIKYISKEGILEGINEGLQELRLAMDGKAEIKSARKFINEL